MDELSVAAYFVSISVNPILYLSRHKDLRRYACKVQTFLQELLTSDIYMSMYEYAFFTTIWLRVNKVKFHW